MLIESSKTQQREVPALLYSVNAVWFMMASPDHFKISSGMLGSPSNDKAIFRQSGSPFIRKSHDGFMRLPDDSHITVNSTATEHSQVETTDRHRSSVTISTDPTQKVEPDTEEEEEDGGIKKKMHVCFFFLIKRPLFFFFLL